MQSSQSNEGGSPGKEKKTKRWTTDPKLLALRLRLKLYALYSELRHQPNNLNSFRNVSLGLIACCTFLKILYHQRSFQKVSKPRIVFINNGLILYPDGHPRRVKKKIYWELPNHKRWEYEDEDFPINLYPENPECKPMYKWQASSHPTCNIIHEHEVITFSSSVYDSPHNRRKKKRRTNISSFISSSSSSNKFVGRLIGMGWWRLTFHSKSLQNESIAFKTMRLDRDFSNQYVFYKHKNDAIIYDRMTKSRYITDIYSYCSNAGMFEFANGGYNLEQYLFDTEDGWNLNKEERLLLALDIVRGLADLHSMESIDGYSPIVHSDIIVNQYVLTKPDSTSELFKLNDFNRGHLMYWNTTSDQSTCPYKSIEQNPGLQRAPEEILYTNKQTEKIDVWSLGHILFMILTNEYPFYDELEGLKETEMEDVQAMIVDGLKPKFPPDIADSDHVVDEAFMHVILNMCLVDDWEERSKAIEIRDYLEGVLYDITQRRKW